MYPRQLIKIVYIILYLCYFIYISAGSSLCNVPNHCVNIKQCPFIVEMMNRNLSADEKKLIRQSRCEKRSVCCPIDLPKPSECGVHYPVWDKLYGGVMTNIEEFPWTVLIRQKGGTFKYQLCGGSLINKRYILTAAHCIKSKDIITKEIVEIEIESALLGEWNKTSIIDCKNGTCASPTVEIGVEKVIVYETYIPASNSADDIALLRLSNEVNYTKYIQPICLPLGEHLRNNLFHDSTTFTVIGWGKTEHTNYTSEIKLKAALPSYNRRHCRDLYWNNYRTVIRDTQICAGGEPNIDTCKGDSGGPLIGLNYENQYDPKHYIAGIVSYGPYPCAEDNTPGIYTRVGAYIDWILKNIDP